MKRTSRKTFRLALALAVCVMTVSSVVVIGRQADARIPPTPLKFGIFTARFEPGGTFKVEGDRWPTLNGNWKLMGDEIEFLLTGEPPKGCGGPGRYRVRADGVRVGFDLVADECGIL